MITAEELLENRDLREQLINRLEVLDKVKQVVTMPNTELLTIEQVADYYEVDAKTIDKIVNRHLDELTEDGYKVYSRAELINLLNRQNVDLKNLKGKTIITIDNQSVIIPNRGLRLFTRRALLRVGMLLRDSEIAKRVRTYLLDVENLATEEQKLRDITEEDRLLLRGIKAESLEERIEAINEIYKYYNRFKIQAEESLKENLLLAKGISSWHEREAINKLIRKLANIKYNGNYVTAWSKLYDEMLYKHHINVRARLEHNKGKTMFDVLNSEEVIKAFQSAVALCKEADIDTNEILQKVKNK